MALVIATVSTVLVVALLTAVLIFRRAARWCPECGRSLVCPDTEHHQLERPQVRL